jgi:hypothetical protein
LSIYFYDVAVSAAPSTAVRRASREQRLRDGRLLDLSRIACEAGFRAPVAISKEALHCCLADPPDVSPGQCSSSVAARRLWSVLWAAAAEVMHRHEYRQVFFIACLDPADPALASSVEVRLKLMIDVGSNDRPGRNDPVARSGLATPATTAVRPLASLTRRGDASPPGGMLCESLLENITQPDSEVLTSNATVKAVRVPESKRMNTLPRYFGRQLMMGEALVYQSLQSVCDAYSGGFWNFFELSNGGFYMTSSRGGATAHSVRGQRLRGRRVV